MKFALSREEANWLAELVIEDIKEGSDLAPPTSYLLWYKLQVMGKQKGAKQSLKDLVAGMNEGKHVTPFWRSLYKQLFKGKKKK